MTADHTEKDAHNEPEETGSSPEPHYVHIPYCLKCRDICLGDRCSKCGSKAVQTEGTISEYKKVGQALLDHNSEWREMLERMIKD